MPIGKNSIKRVANNGYSKVATPAPDMENSTVLANPAPEVIEVMIPSAKKCAAKKAPAKKPAAKKPQTQSNKKNNNKEKEKVAEAPAREDGFSYVNLGGGALPVYLL